MNCLIYVCLFSSLYIFKISPLSDVDLVKIFSHSLYCHFVPLMVSFVLQKLQFHLLNIGLSACVLFKKFSGVSMCLRIVLINSIILSGLEYLDLYWGFWSFRRVLWMIDMYIFTFFCMLTSSRLLVYVKDAFPFPLYGYGFLFKKNQVSKGMCILVWSSLWFHWLACAFMSMPCSF